MIRFSNIGKNYHMSEVEVKALREVSFEIEDGEFVVILGASGAGKSTILNLLGGMDTATAGEITVGDVCVTSLNEKELSVGKQQRVAIARAIAKNPHLLLCDEPTGALDYQTGKTIIKLLQDINRMQKKTVVLITHNSMIAPIADKVIKIKSGQVESISRNEIKQSVEGIEW